MREIPPPTNDPHHRMDLDTRKTLIATIPTSRIWIDELVKGATDANAIRIWKRLSTAERFPASVAE